MEYVAKTDVGKIREKNEDYFLVKKFSDNEIIYIIADGLGGYESGEVASKIATEIVAKYFEEFYIKNERKNIKDVIKKSIILANNEIYNLEKTDSKYKGMGTTIVILCVIGSDIYYASVGDSRIYNVNTAFSLITQITEDDTYVNALLKTNVINELEALNHPQKHVLTRAVGVFSNIDVDVYKLDRKFDGYIVLCTDGVTNMLDEKEILSVFKKYKFEQLADRIIAKANENGGSDNITLIIIKL